MCGGEAGQDGFPYKAKRPVDIGSSAVPLSEIPISLVFLPYMGSTELREG